EAQVAPVDAQYRHLVARQRAGGAKHAAIAANHDHQVADLAEVLARTDLLAVARQHFGDFLFENHVEMAVEQEALEPADGIQDLGTAQAANNADIAKLLDGTPVHGAPKCRQLWGKAPRRGSPGRRRGNLGCRAQLCSTACTPSWN